MAAKKAKAATITRSQFAELLAHVKSRIQTSQTRAMLAVNAELVRLYWDIGQMIDQRQRDEGWGTGVIPRLTAELKNEIPEVKGFSERNIKRMLSFYRNYPAPAQFVSQDVAQISASASAAGKTSRNTSLTKMPQAVAQLAEQSLPSNEPSARLVSLKMVCCSNLKRVGVWDVRERRLETQRHRGHRE